MNQDGSDNMESALHSEGNEYTLEEIAVAERTEYLTEFSNTLASIKDFGSSISDYTKMYPEGIMQEAGIRMINTFEGVYYTLGRSKGIDGDEFRQINGVHLGEVDGINISEAGINIIVPKEFGKQGTGVVVTLGDLESVKKSEFETISRIVKGDLKKIKIVQNIINKKGLSMLPLFHKE